MRQTERIGYNEQEDEEQEEKLMEEQEKKFNAEATKWRRVVCQYI